MSESRWARYSGRLPLIVGAALLVVVGTATAAQTIDGRNIKDETITRAKIAPNAMGAAQIAAGAVDTSELRNGAVRSEDIAAKAVVAGTIAPGAVGASQLASKAVTAAKIAPSAVGTQQIADHSIKLQDLASDAVVTTVVVRTAKRTVQNGPAITASINCKSGELAAAGGYAGVPAGKANALSDRPIPAVNGEAATGWSVTVRNATGKSFDISVYVLCAKR